jgi:DNA topoisomerase-2
MGLDEVRVSINIDEQLITIRDNGGIPVAKHKEAGCYVPEFIFGQLRTSSNYDDTEDRAVVGTNGVGSALSNVFSDWFKVITADKKKSCEVLWQNNM